MSFRPSKQLGQNFLVNQGIVAKIIAAANLSEGDTVLEVGPGTGTLTEELIKYAGHVVAIEKDKQLFDLLQEKFRGAKNLELISADILRYNLQITKYKLIANIPYNITGQIFHNFLLAKNRPSMIIVMVQKEVGERLLGKNKSILSLAASLYGRAEKVCDVSPGSFNPPPKVTSMVVKMVANSSPRRGEVGRDLIINPPHPSFSEGGSPEMDFEMERRTMQIAKIGFSSRRKKLVSNLSTGLKISKEKLSAVFGEIGLDENVRAEELDKDDWLKLAKNIG